MCILSKTLVKPLILNIVAIFGNHRPETGNSHKKSFFPLHFLSIFLVKLPTFVCLLDDVFCFSTQKRIGKLVSAQHFFSLFGQKIPNKSHVFSLVVSVCVWPTWKLAIRKIQAFHEKSVFQINIQYRLNMYELLNRTSSGIVREAAASRLANEFLIVLPQKNRKKE